MPQALEQKVLQQVLKLWAVVFSRSQINGSHGFAIARLYDRYQFLLPVILNITMCMCVSVLYL